MNRKHKIFILLVALLYVVYHLVTLSYSPLPWFDEVSYASITNSYIKSHTFYQEAMNINTPGQNAMYGPMYFALQAWVIKMWGWSMFNFRLSNLLFGFANLYLVYLICRRLKFNVTAIVFTLAIIAFDRSYNQFLHSGRMDSMTIFFFLSSYIVFPAGSLKDNKKWILQALFTGILLSCAVLTTPRILFAFSFYLFYFFYEVYENRNTGLPNILLKYLIILVTFCSLFYWWIYAEFGSLQNYVYVNYTSNKIMQSHIGVNSEGIRPGAAIFYFVFAFVCLAVLLARKLAYKNIRLILFTIPVIISFMLMVGGALAGRYYAMVAPFTIIFFVGVTINTFKNFPLRLLNYIITGLLVAGFLAKGFYVFSNYSQRDPVSNEQAIMKYIPAGATVAGDFPYYYFARRNNCNFQALKENGPSDSVMNYFRARNYDYFIFSKDNQELDAYKTRVLNGRYELIADIDDKPQSGWLYGLTNKLGYKITESYSCYIYKYIGGTAPNK